MKSSFSFIKDSVLLRMTIAVVAGVFLVVGTAGASTTISTNILTGGTLGALGVSTFGATASTTISAAGLLVTPGATVNGTLGVVGIATFGATASTTISTAGLLTTPAASTTMLSCLNNCTFGSSATSSFTAAGVLTLQNGETISNATDNTIAVTATNVTFSGLASSTTMKVGSDAVSTISGLIFGSCTLGTAAVTSASTTYADCTGATGVTSSYKVFVQATSSIPVATFVTAASSTETTGTINVRLHATNGAADITAATVSLNFWAVR